MLTFHTKTEQETIALGEKIGRLLKKGDIIAMCAFGAGLTTGSCVIRWNKGEEK